MTLVSVAEGYRRSTTQAILLSASGAALLALLLGCPSRPAGKPAELPLAGTPSQATAAAPAPIVVPPPAAAPEAP